ncbi:MAG: hypothetical protein R3B93_14240 [Bacteroidia bacterium]
MTEVEWTNEAKANIEEIRRVEGDELVRVIMQAVHTISFHPLGWNCRTRSRAGLCQRDKDRFTQSHLPNPCFANPDSDFGSISRG